MKRRGTRRAADQLAVADRGLQATIGLGRLPRGHGAVAMVNGRMRSLSAADAGRRGSTLAAQLGG